MHSSTTEFGLYVPAGHFKQLLLDGCAYVPSGQVKPQLDEPENEYEPKSQEVQLDAPADTENVPAAQSSHKVPPLASTLQYLPGSPESTIMNVNISSIMVIHN